MPSITVLDSLSSGFTPEYQDVRTLEVEGPVFPGGAFGDVYDLVAVNGAPPPAPQIVKVLRNNGFGSVQRGFDTIEKLQRKILDDALVRNGAHEPSIRTLPALRALPQFSFCGEMAGAAVCGYSADRLDTAGYVPLSAILDPCDDPEPRARYVAELRPRDRFRMAYELAAGLEALQRLKYIHADINPPNLFVNVAEGHVALIDFDSGAVTVTPGDSPTTFGKRTEGEWVAPEVMEQMLAHRSGSGEVSVNRFSDDWALTVGIHYLLFLCGPFFTLERATPGHIREYVTRFRWPAFDPGDPLFVAELEENHALYEEMLAELPPELLRRMSDAFNRGALVPGSRTLPSQWVAALEAALEPLEIILFQAGPAVVLEGLPVRLTWRVSGAHRVSIDQGVGEVDEAGSCEVFPEASVTYTLTAEACADLLVEQVRVRVAPMPQLHGLYLPTPEFSRTVILRSLHISAPTVALSAPVLRLAPPLVGAPPPLHLSVRFQPPSPDAGLAQASPQGPASARAWRWPDRLPRVGEVFDRLRAALQAELNAHTGSPP